MSEPTDRPVSASELVDALSVLAGSEVSIGRNGGLSTDGTLLDVSLGTASVDGRSYPVVHLVINRRTRDGSTPSMVSLLTEASPDEDYFWPVCPIDVTSSGERTRFLLR